MSEESGTKTKTVVDYAEPVTSSERLPCLVVIYTPGKSVTLGSRWFLDRNISIGRGSENAIVLDSESVSRRHSRLELRNTSWWACDLNSTNGTYVNHQQVKEAALQNGDLVKVGDTIFKYLTGSDVEVMYHEEIFRMTIVDGLTNAFNRRHFGEALDSEVTRARRFKRELSLLLIDIDHFSAINDRYGHLAGDHVLKEIAEVCAATIPAEATLARYGGEEFFVILPEMENTGALALADRVRRMVEEYPFRFELEKIQVTISVGVVSLNEDEADASVLTKKADEAVIAAKRAGRNRVGASAAVGSGSRMGSVAELWRALHDRNPWWAVAVPPLLDAAGLPLSSPRRLELLDAMESGLIEGSGRALAFARYDTESLLVLCGDRERLDEMRRSASESATGQLVPAVEILGRSAWTDLEEFLRAATAAAQAAVASAATPHSGGWWHFPYPLAVMCWRVDTQVTGVARIKALCDLVEVVVRWLGTLAIATQEVGHRTGRVGQILGKLGDSREGRRLTAGAWLEIVRAWVQGEDSEESPRAPWLHAELRPPRRKFADRIRETLNGLVEKRNRFAHDPVQTEGTLAQEQRQMEVLVGEILEWLSPLKRMKLVHLGPAEIAEKSLVYTGKDLSGPVRPFRSLRRELPNSILLPTGRAYLLGNVTDQVLSLHPWVCLATCPKCGADEVFLANAPSDDTDLSAIETGHLLASQAE